MITYKWGDDDPEKEGDHVGPDGKGDLLFAYDDDTEEKGDDERGQV